MANKRSRGKNFSDEETLYILYKIEEMKHIIENKATNATTNQEKVC